MDYVKKFADLAEKYPKDPAAVDALVLGLHDSPHLFRRTKEASDMSLKDHIKSEKIGPLTSRLAGTADGEKVAAKNLEREPA